MISEAARCATSDFRQAGSTGLTSGDVTMTEIVGRLEIAFRQKGSGPPPKPCMHVWMPGNDNFMDDMAARLSAHRGVAATYVDANPVGTGDTQPTDCSGTALGVERDTCEWSNALKGNTELSGSSAIGAMIGGRGCIEQLAGVDPPSYRVTVTWQGLSPTVVPSVGCGQSLYGANDALRRAVVKVVSIAALGP